MFLTADGESSGTRCGNEPIRVTDEGVLTLQVPAALVPELGIEKRTITAPVSPATHRGGEWADRITRNRALRYDLHRDGRGRWYLDTHPGATPRHRRCRATCSGLGAPSGSISMTGTSTRR